MSNTKNLMQRLIGVMDYMGAIGKSGKTTYGERFAYHRIDDIDDKLRQALIEHGVVILPAEIKDHKLEYYADENREGKLTWYAECTVEIKLINADNPEERVSIFGWGQGLDYSDKATGKAFSYAQKAAYLSAFHLRGQPDSEIDNIERKPKPPATKTMARGILGRSSKDDTYQTHTVEADPIVVQDAPPDVLADLEQESLEQDYTKIDWNSKIASAKRVEELTVIGSQLGMFPKEFTHQFTDLYKKQLIELRRLEAEDKAN